ncbi:hypothetical protein TEA_017044 [Camellia sinensis var. sinensis]|uniref:Small acidic protein-like domain-containing protein n=1 Tax=Camellia sinensis var. sinensis TaxID=542762 RepID=A0A4S4DJZ1_CAMSN|nr:hypothetical protein TEA_017044 [Camellia sinensis var. sinensis]
MASSSRGLLTLFPDLNESTRERTGAVASETQPNTSVFAPLNFPMRSVEQKMAVQTDIEANQYTLKSCVETMTAVTNLSHRLQSRTNEVQQLNSQLALLQRMYKDARAEISVLKAENKELKRKATVMFRFGGVSGFSIGTEGDEVDGKLAEIKVQLTRKPEATGDTTHGGRNQMVQISKAGSGELESGNKKNTAAEESGHHWDSALFSDRERQEKFNKLMGVKGDVKVEQKPDNQESSSLLQAEKQRELQLDLEKQYTAGLLGSDILRP